MNTFFVMALTLFLLITLAACSSHNNTPEAPVTESENSLTDAVSEQPLEPSYDETIVEQPTEPSHGWTIEELGTTIIAASAFWDDWWSLRGVFAWDQHIDDSQWQPWSEETQYHPLSRGFSILLPSSGFESLNDIGVHLLQFYTQSWVNRELFDESRFHVEIDGIYYTIFGSPWAFEEYDDILYVSTARYGAMRPDWATATHTLIEQEGNHAIVETTVTAYDHRGSGDEMPIATFHFTFVDGKIESGLGTWSWPETEAWGPSDPENPHPLAATLENFNANAEGETRAFMVDIDGSPSVVAIKFVDTFFAEATLFVFTGSEVIYNTIGSIEGFPFSIGITPEGRLVKVTGDGGNWSYTPFGGATDLASQTDVIIYLFTIYGELADSENNNYYRFPGGWLEGLEGGRYSITEEEFNAIRTRYGLDNIRFWRDIEDETPQILAMRTE